MGTFKTIEEAKEFFKNDKFEYTEFYKDEMKFERLADKIERSLKKGYVELKDLKKLRKLRRKLCFHRYETYHILQPICR